MLQFELGTGKVIKAWDMAVATMKVGERIKLTSAPEFAYGERGAGASIPPNATLHFDMELVDFNPPNEEPLDAPQSVERAKKAKVCLVGRFSTVF